VTNRAVTDRDFWGGAPAFVRRVLRAFPVADTIQFFAQLGVPLHEEADGKLFPDSNRAHDVRDALLAEAERVGVEITTGCRVRRVARAADGFEIDTPVGTIGSAYVALATGGRSLPKSGSDGTGYTFATALGHSLVDTTPALAPLVLDETVSTMYRALSGVAHPAEAALWVNGRVSIRLTGPLLWTHFGVSGPLALNLSRHWARASLEGAAVRVTLSMFPGETFDDVDAMLMEAFRSRSKASLAAILSDRLPGSLADALCTASGVPRDTDAAHVSRDARRSLTRALTELVLPVLDTRGYTYAEVTAGGVPLEEVDSATLESRRCPDLFLVGEILDVDGRLGGFNFQWAWSSAHVVARALAAKA
jgi:predicted Rossmann fold flavoprotein